MYKCFRWSFLFWVVLFLLPPIAFADSSLSEDVVLGYRISEVDYSITGNTRQWLLDRLLDIDEERIFVSLEELEHYINAKEQLLVNERTLTDASVSIELVEEVGSGPALVRVTVQVKDSWNMVILPYAKYDTNEGFLLSLRGRDYSFLGTMETLEMNLDYWYNETGENEFSLNGRSMIPFRLGRNEWLWTVSEELTWVEGKPITFNIENRFDYLLYFLGMELNVGWGQDFYINNPYLTNDEVELFETYSRTRLSLGASLPFGLTLGGDDLRYYFSPSVSWLQGVGEVLRDSRQGISLGWTHSLTLGQVDWVGNFRRGLSFLLTHHSLYNAFHENWDSTLEGYFAFHQAWVWGGINSRLSGFTMLSKDDERDNAGGPLRGIVDTQVDDLGSGLYINVDFPIRMWIWFMSRWFEGHLAPFFDIGFFSPVSEASGVDPLYYSAGIEGFAFAKAARSLYLRVSFGFDLKAVVENGVNPWDVRELYIGLGHHY